MKIFEYINQGGVIMYLLSALNIVGYALMISKFYIFNKEKSTTDQTSKDLLAKLENVDSNKDTNAVIELVKQELSGHVNELEKGLNTIKIIASISPLLGLLGTVIGVLIAFKVMSQTGLSNPASFAEGISMALITTVGGMIVAIPHFIGHNYLIGMVDNLESKLEKNMLNKLL